jgi:sialic acid synthase SpsE
MNSSPYIVAEMSANHLGSLDRALAIIDAAADAGADAIKFQLFEPERLAPDAAITEGPWKGRSTHDLYREAQTPRLWFPTLIERAQARGIDWFSSVFDADGLAFLESLDCPRYKISSFEIVDLDLIRAVAATGKLLIVSTGMATRNEIHKVMDLIDAKQLTLLKCTSAYPAPIEEINLKSMCYLGRCGLSDHTLGNTVAIAATALGASVIEKHLTLLRADGGPDAAFSMEPDEFRQMVTECRRARAALGTVHFGPTPSEIPQLQFRGRTIRARSTTEEKA